MLETEHLVRFSFLAILLIPNLLFGQKHPDKEIDSLLNSGINLILLQDYDKANLTFKEMNLLFPSIPLGNIYLAATEITKSVDYEEELNKVFVDSLLSVAKQKTEILLDKDDENIWYNYYDALIYGYQAYYYSFTGNLVSAFADGVLSLRAFQNCLQIAPNFFEAYIAAGTYNYWKSAQTKSLLWIPFVPDKREDGIEYLEKAINGSSYNKHLAAYSLIWVYIDFEEPEKAIELALSMLKEYPDSRYFRWGLVSAYQRVDKSKAIEVLGELLNSFEKLSKRNYYNDIVIKHKMAMLYEEIGEFDKALTLCNEILDFNLYSANIKERLSNRFDRAANLRDSILERENN